MGRTSIREAKRCLLAESCVRVLATHGLGGTTIAAVAAEASVAPGLLHHHFRDRDDLLCEAAVALGRRFRQRLVEEGGAAERLGHRLDVALALGPDAEPGAARAWVGLFAEALRSPSLGHVLKRLLKAEMETVAKLLRQEGVAEAEARDAAAGLLAFVLGALVLGALLPGAAPGFAASAARRMLAGLGIGHSPGTCPAAHQRRL